LAELDPKAAAKIAPQNVRKVIRALEVIELTGEPFRADYPEPEFIRPTRMFGLAVDRERLRGRIAERVDLMWEQGLVDEVKALRAQFDFSRTALRAIGYAQAIAQLEGELSEQDAKEQTRLLTAQYAKRQISWFRRDTRITWLAAESDPHAQLCKELGLPNEF
jgi:tRNA dimethylallyltransferase